jgi:hypothetical protein
MTYRTTRLCHFTSQRYNIQVGAICHARRCPCLSKRYKYPERTMQARSPGIHQVNDQLVVTVSTQSPTKLVKTIYISLDRYAYNLMQLVTVMYQFKGPTVRVDVNVFILCPISVSSNVQTRKFVNSLSKNTLSISH